MFMYPNIPRQTLLKLGVGTLLHVEGKLGTYVVFLIMIISDPVN
jgi:hypothetical protein